MRRIPALALALFAAACAKKEPALRFQAGAAAVSRGMTPQPFLRVALPLEDLGLSIAAASDLSSYALTRDGAAVDLAASRVYVFPDPAAIARPSFAVLIVPGAAAGGQSVAVRVKGATFAYKIEAPSKLATISVQPVRVSGDGASPNRSVAELAAYFARFERFFTSYCNIGLDIRPGVDIDVPGAGSITNSLIGDPRILNEAGLPQTLWIMNRAFRGAATHPRAPPGDAARVFVFPGMDGNFPEPRAYFHSDLVAGFGYPAYYAPLPAYTYDTAQYGVIIDPATPRSTLDALIQREDPVAMEAEYLDDDTVDLFLHVTGHLMGLPHPNEDSLIDSGGGDVNDFISGRHACLPDCNDPFITQHQCEIMLSGMNGHLR